MKIRAIDSNGDWVFGHGKASYLVAQEAVVQDINTALNFFLGEAFWKLDFGVDWFNLIGAKAPLAQANILLQCRQVILTRHGVTRINRVSANFMAYRRSLSIQYDIDTIYGRASTSITKGFNLN